MEDFELNPFFEEFDKADVVNKQDEDKKSALEQEEKFSNVTTPDAFRDFLQVPKISGSKSNCSHSSLIPSQSLDIKEGIVEISDYGVKDLDERGDSRSSVVINRNDEGFITRIEVLCSCGERTVIDFEEGID